MLSKDTWLEFSVIKTKHLVGTHPFYSGVALLDCDTVKYKPQETLENIS